ncbi:cell division protein ZipA C-terminal FtsZ-binding domain-containing protein [Candidatus Endoriftia persephone]|jgi:cell division protein ZipA|nr:cell division protein ZipA C-terminal FtsZ-binding domain-containing protein [Candidatus Endoriftia persephone]USF89118.1 cell division protein ZipA C-terminal FtsZ-binding domain-containing protein [Candidatus Endoriftia persephone]
MDSGTLRLILIGIGILFLIAIYYWDRLNRKDAREQARQKLEAELDEADESSIESAFAKPVGDPDELSLGQLDSSLDDDLSPFDRAFSATDEQEPQEEIHLEVDETSPLDVPHLILQIHLLHRGDWFDGEPLERALSAAGLQPGKMKVYHRLTGDGSRRVVYTVANLAEPGTFPLGQMGGFKTPGLAFFAQLPGPQDGQAIFNDMLKTAEQLAARLGGELHDQSRSVLTRQTIEHMREQIIEHGRKVRLARSKG